MPSGTSQLLKQLDKHTPSAEVTPGMDVNDPEIRTQLAAVAAVRGFVNDLLFYWDRQTKESSDGTGHTGRTSAATAAGAKP